jgi:hypothetical protein
MGMSFPKIIRSSPNFAAAPPHERLGVLVHHSELPFADTIVRMLEPASAVSHHCLHAALAAHFRPPA